MASNKELYLPNQQPGTISRETKFLIWLSLLLLSLFKVRVVLSKSLVNVRHNLVTCHSLKQQTPWQLPDACRFARIAACKQGSAKVLAAFHSHPVAGVYSCGQQLSGMRQWTDGDGIARSFGYSRVQPAEVPTVVKRHLKGGCPVAAMLYPRFHQGWGQGSGKERRT